MFENLKNLFGATASAEARPELNPRVAAAALLVEAALVDGIYADSEQAQITAILQAAFELDSGEAAKLLDQAEELAEAAIDHHRFTKVIKACLSGQERVALLEQLWLVSLADGERSPFEEAFIRRISPLLALTDRDRVFARSRAEARLRSR
ncbi:tellurite resistance TerB family protein [Maricaulis sp. CAU 1757]